MFQIHAAALEGSCLQLLSRGCRGSRWEGDAARGLEALRLSAIGLATAEATSLQGGDKRKSYKHEYLRLTYKCFRITAFNLAYAQRFLPSVFCR